MSKLINEMTDEELEEEIHRLRAVQPPSAPSRAPRGPKRLDEGKPRRRKSIFDQLEE